MLLIWPFVSDTMLPAIYNAIFINKMIWSVQKLVSLTYKQIANFHKFCALRVPRFYLIWWREMIHKDQKIFVTSFSKSMQQITGIKSHLSFAIIFLHDLTNWSLWNSEINLKCRQSLYSSFSLKNNNTTTILLQKWWFHFIFPLVQWKQY